MRIGRVLLTIGIAIGFLPVLGVGPASACSCFAAGDKKLYSQADVVFKGKVTRTQYPANYENDINASPIIYTMKATRDYKGRVRPTMKIRTAGNDALCGISLGKGAYIVFADRNGKGRLVANLCGGTRPFDGEDQPYFAPGKKVG
ncbi:hypothetical protein [Sporichthya sp.]|uniref:hypothetical protein n=1 Tax=Sporichthya sp. TaxID=65475 RepID=UPI0017C4F06C|nr:hypothetical protein [Sporichthya sp.]MBA3745621.1 hypothetical protein [Sporichthya sp.]